MATKKKSPAKKPAPAAKKAAAPAPKAAPAKSSAAKPVAGGKPAAPGKGKASAADLKRLLLERKTAPKAIAFSLDEVREIAKKNEKQVETAAKTGKNGKPGTTTKQAALATDLKPHKP